MGELQLQNQKQDNQIQQFSNWVGELQLQNQKQDNQIQVLKTHIQGQEKRIETLESEVCELNDKAYRPDLRGMLNLFRRKVYLILFYSISNTLILFLLLHVVGSDTVKKKTFGLPRRVAHRLF